MSQIIKVLMTDIPLSEEHVESLKEEGYHVLNGPSQTTYSNENGLAVPLLQVVGTKPRLEGGKGVPMLLSFNVTAFLQKMGAPEKDIQASRTAWQDDKGVEQMGYGHALGTDIRYDMSSDEDGVDVTYYNLLEWHSAVKGLLDKNNRVILRQQGGGSTGIGLFRPDLSKGLVELSFSLTKMKNSRGSFFAFEGPVVLPNSGGLSSSLGARMSTNKYSSQKLAEIAKSCNNVVSKKDMPAPDPTQQTQPQPQAQGSPFVTFS